MLYFLANSPAGPAHTTDVVHPGNIRVHLRPTIMCWRPILASIDSKEPPLIPHDKTDAVHRALREAFITTALDEIHPLPTGLDSDLDFRILVHGAPYLLKIMTAINERNDPRRVFAAMRTEADAGLSPRVWYANPDDGIAILDLLPNVPLPIAEALARIPGTLRKLHTLPPFPKTFNYVTAHNGFIWRFRKTNLLPASEIEEVFSRYDQLCAIYPRVDADMVSCHGDLKPENIVFDGHRLWLVGWKAAFVNDRYFDLAVVASFLIAGDSDESACLSGYFGQSPDDYQRSRFFLMRQVLHMLSATLFLILSSAGQPVDQHVPIPSFHHFHQRLWAGEIDLADKAMQTLYGRVHWHELSRNLRSTRFDEALRIVSARHPRLDPASRLLPISEPAGITL